MPTHDPFGARGSLGPGLPETRGWPAAPFPTPGEGGVIPWVNLAKGASGPIVEKVQLALNANGADLEADGQFGTLTENAVKAYQTSRSLPSTGTPQSRPGWCSIVTRVPPSRSSNQ